MKYRSILPAFFYSLALLSLTVLTACSEPAPEATVKHSLPSLHSITLAPTKVAQEVKFDGVIEAVNQATVSAQTTGRVLELPFDVGDFVKKGDLIVRFTDTEQKARVANAEAKFNEAKAQFSRMQDMLQKKLIAKADFDKAESAFKSADAALSEANENFGYTRIHAPYSGIVVKRMIKLGETVAPGMPLISGLSLEQLRVQVDIPQQHIGPVRLFKKASVIFADGSRLETSDLRIPPSADLQTHSFKVLVNLPEGDYSLFPNTLVKIAFVNGETETLLVPASAVAVRGEVTGVYVIANNQIEFRLVRLGSLTIGNQYPVLAGLHSGETIAIDPVAATNAYKNSAGN